MGYWENRQAKEMYEAMESAEEAAKEIADVYAMASKELNYKIAQTYEKYRDKYNLSDEEAKKLLNAMRDPSDIEELKMKLKGLKRPEADEILKELESPAYRARIERYENLQSEIDKMMKDVYKQEKKINTNHYVDQYNDSYYREIYDLQKRTGLDFSFSNVDPKELDRILHSNWSGENYSQRIWGNTEKLAQDVKQQLALAYLTGKNESDIAAEIARLYATGAAYARRLIRTESAYISGQAQAAADEEAGIDSYRILATLDLRTSEICREMDGKVFEYKDMQVGVNFPPFHPYCRTTVLSEIDDQDLSQLQRRSRDPETGKIKTFPGDITYKDWYKQEVLGKPDIMKQDKVWGKNKRLTDSYAIKGTSIKNVNVRAEEMGVSDFLKTVNPDIADGALTELQKMKDEFGDIIVESIQPLDPQSAFDGEYRGGHVYLKNMVGKNAKDRLIARASEMKKAGKWSTASEWHTFRHEYAHGIISSKSLETSWGLKQSEISDIFNTITKKAEEMSIEEARRFFKNELSIYAMDSIDEFIAEAVAEYLNNPKKCRNTARSIVAILKR